jgi:hypothetical protein
VKWKVDELSSGLVPLELPQIFAGPPCLLLMV